MSIERFIQRTTRRGSCLLWTGARNNYGYGVVRSDGRLMLAHRLSYLLHRGPIPDGAILRHHCDTPACVAPWHLTPGTHSENLFDAYARGRRPSWRDARELRALDDAFIATTCTTERKDGTNAAL